MRPRVASSTIGRRGAIGWVGGGDGEDEGPRGCEAFAPLPLLVFSSELAMFVRRGEPPIREVPPPVEGGRVLMLAGVICSGWRALLWPPMEPPSAAEMEAEFADSARRLPPNPAALPRPKTPTLCCEEVNDDDSAATDIPPMAALKACSCSAACAIALSSNSAATPRPGEAMPAWQKSAQIWTGSEG